MVQDQFTQLAKSTVDKVNEHLPELMRNKLTEKLQDLQKMTNELPKLAEALGALSENESPSQTMD